MHSQAVWLTCAIGEWRNGNVNGIDASVDGREVSGSAQACGFVGMNPDRNIDFLFQPGDDIMGDLWWNESGHVLDDDCGGSHFGELHTQIDKALGVVDGTRGVADHAVGLFARVDRCFDGELHVAGVVQGIEDTEDIHAVFGGGIDKGLDNIVGEVGVLHDVLAAKQHHVLGFWTGFFKCVQAIEWKLVEEAESSIDGCASPGFKRTEVHAVEDGGDFEHLLGSHTRCCE